MIEQIGVALPFTAFYQTLGLGTTGLTVTVDVYRNGAIIVTGASATEAGGGLYTYTLASGSNNAEGVYAAIFKTATSTVDQQHLVAGWYVGKAGVEYLDASIAAVKTKTDNLPPDPADESLLEAYISSETTGLATSAALSIVTSMVTTIEGSMPSALAIDSQLSGTHGAGTWVGGAVNLAVAKTDAAAVVSGELSITSYAQFSQSVTSSLTANLSAAKIWLSIKDSNSETDAQSLVFVEKTGGLTVVAKSTYATPADGSLIVSGSSGAWVIALTLKAAASALLHGYSGSGKNAEIKALVGGDVLILWSGHATISQGVIRAIT